MKPRNREINIFNLSMLDVISGAMGAFLIIMVILLPYYKKETIDYARELTQSRASEEAARKAAQTAESAQRSAEAAARKAEESARAAQADADQNRQRAAAAAQQLAKTFLLVHIQWGTKYQDVDLHVVDPNAAEFSYEHKTYPGRPGALSVDSQFGPGNEVWSNPSASPGDYRIYANLYNTHGVTDTPTVTGSVIHRDGSTALPSMQLTALRQKTLMATVTVSADGRVSIH
jgi:uncharacterized protein YfaP (DUF2135 family)